MDVALKPVAAAVRRPTSAVAWAAMPPKRYFVPRFGSTPVALLRLCFSIPIDVLGTSIDTLLTVVQKSKGTWEAAKEATMEAEKQGAEAHLKSCEAEHLLQSASELTQAAANARAREEEVSKVFLC